MRIARVILVIVGLLAIAATGLVVAAQYVDWNSYRPELEKMVKDATGRDLKIDGDLELQLFPTPRLAASGLSFANASWGSKSPMIEAQRLVLTIVPRALLAREIRLRTISLGQAEILLQSDARGQGNWEIKSSGGGDTPFTLFDNLSTIEIDGLNVTWHPHGEDARSFAIDQARISRPLIRQGFEFSATGSADGESVTLDGKLSSLAGYLGGKGLSGKIRQSSPSLEIDLEGEFGQLPALDGLDISVKARGTRWPVLAQMQGFPTGVTPPWKIQLKLKSAPGKFTVAEMESVLDENTIAGDFDMLLGGTRPRVAGKFQAGTLDVTRIYRWWTGEAAVETGPATTGGKLFSNQPVQTDWMDEVDLDVELIADKLITEDLELDTADVTVKLADGRLVISADAGVFGGKASARVDAQAVGGILQYKHRLELRDADTGRITGRWTTPPLIEATGNLNYDVSGSGRSMAEYWASANGSVRLVVGAGTVRAGAAERAVRGLVSTLFLSVLAKQTQEDKVKLNCIASDVTISDGIASFDVLVLDTGESTLVGKGTADLRNETWDLKINPRPKRTTLNAATSIVVTGPFDDPDITLGKIGVLKKLAGAASLFVFPPAAVAGLGELGAGDNVCIKLVAGASQ